MTNKVLDGKIALITGAGTGIGRAIAERFAAEGARVVLAGRRADVLEQVAALTGGKVVTGDVSVEADAQNMVAEAVRVFGGLDILVNNAGISGPIANVADIDLDAFDQTLDINVRGTIACIKYAIAPMVARGGGSIVNLSSLMGLRGYPMRAAYSASKFAVIGLTQAIAHEVGVHNIRVNALCPGAISGELMDRVIARRAAAENRSPEDIIKANYTDVAALRRWVDPGEVASAALFYASDASSSVTGDHMRVDAGRL